MAVTSSGTAVVTLPTATQILITRTFDAPRQCVYAAWTTPDLNQTLVGGDRGVVTVTMSTCGSVGPGAISQASGGFEVPSRWYREIVPNERIVATEVFEGMAGAEAVSNVYVHRAGWAHHVTILGSTRARSTGTHTSTRAWKAACKRRGSSRAESRAHAPSEMITPAA